MRLGDVRRRERRPLLFLGVDTSSYTTSVALVGEAGETVLDAREPLQVPPGALGLRQSDAVFLHLRQLPGLLEAAFEQARLHGEVAAVGVSARPRPQPDSYLPVFVVGLGFARAVARAAGAELVLSSHQEGHVACGLGAGGGWPGGAGPATDASEGAAGPGGGAEVLVLHASGGTTEMAIYALGREGPRLARVLGSSLDLHAGQFVDRLGQAMGLAFPAGPALEALAASGRPRAVHLPEAVRGYRASFSGPHSAALRCLEAGAEPADVALAALDCLARTFGRILARAQEEVGLGRALVVGGVAANLHLRRALECRLAGQGKELELGFPPPPLCTDSAVGPARLARWRFSAIEGAAASG
ncbi:MAG: hypothetical protein K6T75_10350 [Acetobacteraceae bacterium]|nr:hypothetical protein [Acetobacteraceae bacterium]